MKFTLLAVLVCGLSIESEVLPRHDRKISEWTAKQWRLHGVPDLREFDLEFAAQGLAESGGDAHAESPAGALGWWQILPSTGAEVGVSPADLWEIKRSTWAATRIHRNIDRIGQHPRRRLKPETTRDRFYANCAAYNWGAGHIFYLSTGGKTAVVGHLVATGKPFTVETMTPHMPRETRHYLRRIQRYAELLGRDNQ